MIRIVNNQTEEAATADFRHDLPGRGAYVHRTRSCIERGVQVGRLAGSFKAAVPAMRISTLRESLLELCSTGRSEQR